jgi:UDP-N-acetyl-D-glucosamine dehydrogenase
MFKTKVGIVGLGYVGLALVKTLCNHGHYVVGLDIDESKVLNLSHGISPNESIRNEELSNFISSGAFQVTTDAKNLLESNVVIIAVPTPLDEKGFPDYEPLKKACELIARHLKRDVLLINESTSHPGTLRDLIAPLISGLRDDSASGIMFACSPERVNPGDSKFDHSNTPRVVSGLNEQAKNAVRNFYSEFVDEVFLASAPEVAEMSKLLENSFRLVNISFINELSDYCLSRGIPVREVIAAASTKPFGFMPFLPGAGVGGHCIPVDPAYLLGDAAKHGFHLPILETAISANASRHQSIIHYLDQVLDGVAGKNILIEGVTYKPDVKDTRETPAHGILEGLRKSKAVVCWHDPIISDWGGALSTPVTSKKWDAVLLLIKHKSTDVDEILANAKLVFDFTGTMTNGPAKVKPV